MDNLRHILLAMHDYEGLHHRLPSVAERSPEGKPLLSWRVSILPFLEEHDAEKLFHRFHLDEPWDSPHNIKLMDPMPEVYASRSRRPLKLRPERCYTCMQALVGKGAAFEGSQGLQFQDFPDGLSTTIWLVEGGQPVPWTKPEDIPYASDQPLPQLATVRTDGFLAGHGDASVHFIKNETPERVLRALITRNGGEKIEGLEE